MEVLKISLICLLALLTWAPAQAQSSLGNTRENQIQASLILRIVNFIDWPGKPSSQTVANAKSGGPFMICSYQGAAIGTVFQQIQNPEWRRQAIQFKSISRTDPSELSDCSVLYVDNSVKAGTPPPQLNRLLTIGNNDEFIQAGGILALVKRENRYSFDINLDSARQVGLRIETPLIRMANRVINTQ